MNPPQDPRQDPNQDDEAALARVLRALPGGEPSPRVDAAILAAARNATAGSPVSTHRRRGLPGWALGTAAAAVLAVGIGLQLQPTREALPEGIPAQAPAESMADAAADSTEAHAGLESIEVTGSRLLLEEAIDADTVPPPAKPQARAPATVLAPPEPEADVMAPPPPPPAAQAPAREARAEATRRLEAQAADRQQLAAPALPSAFSADDVLPPVDDDARLAPDAWLERIRERIRQGDRGGASASLQRFQRAHPDVALPPDLAAFRP